MAFKEIEQPVSVPDSPEKLFLDLPRRKIPNVLPHQQEIMAEYVASGLSEADVAMQLPTGSGKTLVGLLIGEWRRKKNKEKVVYLVPTKQLVNQVVEQANEKYGLTVNGFTGSSKDYEPKIRSEYKTSEKIAVTTYSSLFNSNPFFVDADIIILDDVHSAENYISGLWSLRIERLNNDHSSIHTAVSNLLKPYLESYNYSRLIGSVDSPTDRSWVDKLPTPDFVNIKEDLISILDAHVGVTDLSYTWAMIKDHLHACHLYISSQEILIRPLIPPTWTLPAFENPKQRIYMSATLGEGGDLERVVGRSSIYRLPIPTGWDKHGVGRRFFIFPDMSLGEDGVKDLRLELMRQTDRSLVLVPNNKLKDEIAADVVGMGYKVFGSDDIESSKNVFTESVRATAIIANRYDGIDFPGEECRLLFVEGLPRAMNLQERFLMSRMGANALFNERIQTRVLQAIGRCTRSLEDHSAVVISGADLPDYLADKHRIQYFHPELQAELIFGIEQSRDVSGKNILENLQAFLENGPEWEKVNQQIVDMRKSMTQKSFPAMNDLRGAVKNEVLYQTKMWQGDYEAALGAADATLSSLKDTEVRGYRALWHYLAGASADLAFKSSGSETFQLRSKTEFGKAKDCAVGIPWLVNLARYSSSPVQIEDTEEATLYEQIEGIEAALSGLGATYEKKYARREKDIIDGLKDRNSENPKPFENAQKLLGEMLGFKSDNRETDGAPDPWWINSNFCIVFEDHAGALDGSTLDVTKARQVSTHPNWIRNNIPKAESVDILPVLVTPANKVKRAAMSHLENVAVWPLADFQTWSIHALVIIRELRTTFTESGNLDWREKAARVLKSNELDAPTLILNLKKKKAELVFSIAD